MFNIKNWGGAMLGLGITYIILLALTTGFYFWLAPKNGVVASDIVNISLCAATLLGPIILVFTLSAWKEQEQHKALSKYALKAWLSAQNYLDQLIELSIKITDEEELLLDGARSDDEIEIMDGITRLISADFASSYSKLEKYLHIIALHFDDDNMPSIFRNSKFNHENIFFESLKILSNAQTIDFSIQEQQGLLHQLKNSFFDQIGFINKELKIFLRPYIIFKD